MSLESAWQPIETAPTGVWLIGLRVPNDVRAPAFVGQVYDLRKNALLDEWTGRWVVCTHWMLLPAPPETGDAS